MKLFGVLKPLWPTDRFLRRVIIASVLYQIGLSIAIIFCACLLYSDLTWIQLKNLLSAWDGGHYLYLARYGYQTSGDEATFIAFYPLYPWLIRLTSQILPNEHLAAVSVTILGSIVGHVAFAYYLLKTGCNRSQIWRILCLLFLTPISVYFSMIYTEGMFLAETALCLLALRCDRYAWAAGFGLMASATRLVGILSIVPFISRFIETQRWRSHWQSILWVCLIPLGYGIYLYLNWKFFGDPFHYRGVLGAHWQKTATNPAIQYLNHWRDLLQWYVPKEPTIFIDRISTLIILPVFIIYGSLKSRNNLRLSWGEQVWAWSQWLVIASQSFWLSNTRYLALILPLYIAIEELSWLVWRVIYFAVAAIFGALSIYSIYLFCQGIWLY